MRPEERAPFAPLLADLQSERAAGENQSVQSRAGRTRFDAAALGGRFSVIRIGLNPLQIAERHAFMPCNRVNFCSRELKIEPFAAWLAEAPRPITVHLGLDDRSDRESHRMAKPRARYEAMGSVTVDYPLTWPPVIPPGRAYHHLIEEEWGIRKPVLYAQGFSHNNCSGSCVRQGMREWLRLYDTNYARFAQVADWELWRKATEPAVAHYTICVIHAMA